MRREESHGEDCSVPTAISAATTWVTTTAAGKLGWRDGGCGGSGLRSKHRKKETKRTAFDGVVNDVEFRQRLRQALTAVAAMSGDARRALEICRRAAEVADYRLKQLSQSSNGSSLRDSMSEGKHLVGLNDVEAAIHEVFQAPHIQIMKSSSRLSKILLAAMVHELYRSGLCEVSFEKLATTIRSLCSSNRESVPKWDDLLKVSCKLGECRIILSEEGAKHRLQRMQFNFPSDDVAFALKDCPEIPWLTKYL